jgi:rubrerythrin
MIRWIKQRMQARHNSMVNKIILEHLGKPLSVEDQAKQKIVEEEASRKALQDKKIIQITFDPVTEFFEVKGIQNVRTLIGQMMMIEGASKTLTAHFNKMILNRQDNKIIIPR